MIRFTLRLALRSMRWLGPAILVLVWAASMSAGPGTALSNASGGAMLVVIVACWLTVAIGNVDDDGHRELLTAAIGSPARLQRDRAIAAFVAANVLALAPTVLGIAIAERPTTAIGNGTIIATCIVLQIGATAAGVAIGTLLHRPVVRHTGITLLVAIGALIGLILLPPVQHVLRSLNDDRTDGVLATCAIAIAACVGAVALSGALADRAR